MVKVHLWSGIRELAGGQEAVEVEGRNVGQLLDALARDYPGLADVIEEGVSMAVDGRLIADSLVEPVSPESEVYLLRKLKGG